MQQNEQKAEWIQDNEYKNNGQCNTDWILRLQGQCHENIWNITGSYYALKGHSASGQGGSSWSSPLRSDGSQDDQVGEAGLVEQQLSGGQESQN
jgi:hypothetical protein